MVISEYTTVLQKESGKTFLRKIKNYKVDDSLAYCRSPDRIRDLLESTVKLSFGAEERVYVVLLNTKSRVLGISKVSQGTVNSALVSPREIFLRALLIGATNVVIAHNHPSLDTTPSNEDRNFTRRVKEAGDLINVMLLDSIIVGDNYYSFKENGGL